jgi:hypothetical protein
MLRNFLHEIYYNIYFFIVKIFPLDHTFLSKMFFHLAIIYWSYMIAGLVFSMLGLMIGKRYMDKRTRIMRKMQERAGICLLKIDNEVRRKYDKRV